jgi:hypothetical protein
VCGCAQIAQGLCLVWVKVWVFLFATLVGIPGFFAFRFFGFLVFAAVASANSYLCFMRCPCAGRHLLFFAAAKKSRQKKAAFEPSVPARITLRHTFLDLSRSDANTP